MPQLESSPRLPKLKKKSPGTEKKKEALLPNLSIIILSVWLLSLLLLFYTVPIVTVIIIIIIVIIIFLVDENCWKSENWKDWVL